MIIITREKARTCTDAELRSALAKLYNALASRTLTSEAKRKAQASIEQIRSELNHRGPR
ncbi:MAG: hypothetical protein AAFQ45_02050 [Pseudomonadota bacterium]